MDLSNTPCRTIVVNISNEDCDVYICRPSIFGNPFIIDKDGTRQEVISKYREWILTKPEILARLPELKGKRLGCWCSPKPCHGDVLVELIEQAEKTEKIEGMFSYD